MHQSLHLVAFCNLANILDCKRLDAYAVVCLFVKVDIFCTRGCEGTCLFVRLSLNIINIKKLKFEYIFTNE